MVCITSKQMYTKPNIQILEPHEHHCEAQAKNLLDREKSPALRAQIRVTEGKRLKKLKH